MACAIQGLRTQLTGEDHFHGLQWVSLQAFSGLTVQTSSSYLWALCNSVSLVVHCKVNYFFPEVVFGKLLVVVSVPACVCWHKNTCTKYLLICSLWHHLRYLLQTLRRRTRRCLFYLVSSAKRKGRVCSIEHIEAFLKVCFLCTGIGICLPVQRATPQNSLGSIKVLLFSAKKICPWWS